jgi:NADPH-dependent glutamate synthase beta subunit-like oxidoreductase/NAD(P)H-flavin reductase
MPNSAEPLHLAFGFQFHDLYERESLARLDGIFLDHLKSADVELFNRLMEGRANPAGVERKKYAELLVALAPHVEDFIGELFGIVPAVKELQSRHNALAPMLAFKRKFISKKAISGVSKEQAMAINGHALFEELEALFNDPLTEANFVHYVSRWLESEDEHKAQIDVAARYAAWACLTPAGREKHRRDALFKVPHKLDMQHLVPVETVLVDGVARLALPKHEWRHREGFHLTDPGTNLSGAMDQANYCIKCHNQGKDSCSTGLKEKDGTFKLSQFGAVLAGCPLDEKISEMNLTKQNGYSIGALAIVTVDNPTCAGTGHRICNDCMKSCIFQKQDPVDIPQVETRTLKDVLDLPWGFEIYSLLSRWNPMHLSRPLPKPDSGYKVLVVGLGPAGFTLAHHLMNDGHTVVAVDGLKIEPLPQDVCGVTPLGERHPFRPIRDVNELYDSLNDRVNAGFGGVAEYGITVRWNKNFLKVIRLLLERRAQFSMFGGVRFGGTLTVESSFAMGFDHIALCAGAGRPTVVPMKNGLVNGVRQASDFLMALQLTGAGKESSVANLQVRLPVVVIGGGLTAIDTATESLAYYVVQVEKFLHRHEALERDGAEPPVWTPAEREIAEEFLAHGRAIRQERERAAAEGRQPEFIRLLQSWGGVSIAYRKRMIDAPSYTLNHEEVSKALEEGIFFTERVTPHEVELDAYGAAAALHLTQHEFNPETGRLAIEGKPVRMPAHTILVAAGTQPNTVLAREDSDNVFLDGRWFQSVDEDGKPVKPERMAKPDKSHVLMSIREDGRGISFFGDLHPSYNGNVVKAMASAKQGYPVVSRLLANRPPVAPAANVLLPQLNRDLRAFVHAVYRLTPTIVEVVVKAPLAARTFEPGQFYRLQNFESIAPKVRDTTLAMEGLALTGASVDREQGLLSTIVLEMGGSSDLCAHLKPGEPVILMGPTGMPTETASNETALLVGGGLGNAVLFSIGQELRRAGSKTIYFAGYKKVIDRYKVDEIEKAADVIVWCCDEAPGMTPTRPQDKAFVGNIVEAMTAFGSGQLGPSELTLAQVDRVIAIGSDGMMAAVARARHGVLAPYLKPRHHAVGSINSPMQCMMKEICGQCLQTHRNPETGEETVVFSCFNQDQNLDHVDWSNLRTRLSQNTVQEKLTKSWMKHCLRDLTPRAVAVN